MTQQNSHKTLTCHSHKFSKFLYQVTHGLSKLNPQLGTQTNKFGTYCPGTVSLVNSSSRWMVSHPEAYAVQIIPGGASAHPLYQNLKVFGTNPTCGPPSLDRRECGQSSFPNIFFRMQGNEEKDNLLSSGIFSRVVGRFCRGL